MGEAKASPLERRRRKAKKLARIAAKKEKNKMGEAKRRRLAGDYPKGRVIIIPRAFASPFFRRGLGSLNPFAAP